MWCVTRRGVPNEVAPKRMRCIALGAADEQVGQCVGAGENSYRSSHVRVLDRLAADPWALDRLAILELLRGARAGRSSAR